MSGKDVAKGVGAGLGGIAIINGTNELQMVRDADAAVLAAQGALKGAIEAQDYDGQFGDGADKIIKQDTQNLTNAQSRADVLHGHDMGLASVGNFVHGATVGTVDSVTEMSNATVSSVGSAIHEHPVVAAVLAVFTAIAGVFTAQKAQANNKQR